MSSIQRFALNQEASNIVKSDSSLKAGVNTTACHGPTLSIKADVSTATNKSEESAKKVASQYSQDVAFRAAS